MRRTAVAAAALSAVASLALISPADAAGSADKLTATASCGGGGQIRMVSSVDAAGTGHATVKVRGVKDKRWSGELVLGLDNPDSLQDTTLGDLTSGIKTYVAKHGSFTASAQQANAGGLTSMATFMSKKGAMCMALTSMQGNDQFAAGSMDGGIAVRVGSKATLTAFALGQARHRYRLALSAKTKGGVKHWSAVRTSAGKFKPLYVRVRHVKHLSSFSQASVTITDLTEHGDPVTVTVSR